MAGAAYPAVTPKVPAAHWFEREIHDLFGIVPESHPRLEPLVRHPADEGEVRLPEDQEDVPLEHRGAERLAGPGVFVIPYGPVRSGVFETAQFLVQTGGEDVAYCAQRLFFKRAGLSAGSARFRWSSPSLVAERVSGTSSVAHALAFSHGVEALGPDRGTAAGAGDPTDPGRARAPLQPRRGHGPRVRGRVAVCRPGPVRRAQGTAAPARGRLHREPLPPRSHRTRRRPYRSRRERRRSDRLDACRLGARVASSCCPFCCAPTRSSTAWSVPARWH